MKAMFKTADEAWRAFKNTFKNTDLSAITQRDIFLSGVSVGLSIAFHHGIADVRAEIEREYGVEPTDKE